MFEKEMAERNKILEFRVGSHLYGTATEDSDQDFCGIFIADKEYYIGLKSIEEIDFSIVDKHTSGKNTKYAVDKKLYEIRKFIRLAMDCNPNIIEMLFINDKNILFSDPLGKSLLEYRHIFPWTNIKRKFIGYAMSQKKKMIIKRGNFNELVEANEFLQNLPESEMDVFIIELQGRNLPFFTFKKDFVACGDIKIQLTRKLKKVKNIINDRVNKIGNRKELYLKSGYDTKFASHLIRLLLEGIELLNTGEIVFPLQYADTLLDIKKGKWNMGDVLAYSDDLENTINVALDNTNLPTKPNFDEIQHILMYTINKHMEI